MTAFMHLLSPQTMQALGWTLLHFLWQGTAIAAIAAVTMSVCRSASTRYCLGVTLLGLMLAVPVATFLTETPSGHRQSPRGSYVTPSVSKPPVLAVLASQFPASSPDAFRWLVEAWLIGVVVLSLRSAGGFLLIERERRNHFNALTGPVLEICITLQRRLRIHRAIRYCQCARLQSPAVLGWFRPMVMLPLSAITGLSADQLQSVIAHELAHIKRLDPFVNVFQICVETLLFYHPGVWWLNQRIRAEREHCCDDIAVSTSGSPLEYARALALMEQWRSAPVLAMAATRGSLAARICRLLGLKSETRMRGAGLGASVLCLTTALVAGNTFLGVAHACGAVHSASLDAVSGFAPHVQAVGPSVSANAPSPAQSREKAEPAVSTSSYIDGLKAVGLTDLTADQLIALKIQDVTPDYVRGLRQQGLHPDVGEIIAMRVQDVTPEYVHDLRALGVNADVSRLIALKVQGVTPEYVRDLQAAGVSPDTDRLIAMKVQDVKPEYVRDVRALGLKPTADQMIAMKVQEVTPDYIKVLQSAGFKVNVDDIISAKVQDIAPDFIERARKHGFQNLTLEKLIELKHLGILEPQGDI